MKLKNMKIYSIEINSRTDSGKYMEKKYKLGYKELTNNKIYPIFVYFLGFIHSFTQHIKLKITSIKSSFSSLKNDIKNMKISLH